MTVSDIVSCRCSKCGKIKATTLKGKDIGNLIYLRDELRNNFLCESCRGK